MGKAKQEQPAKRNRALKTKDVDRMFDLTMKHPGDILEEEKVELAKLKEIESKYGCI